MGTDGVARGLREAGGWLLFAGLVAVCFLEAVAPRLPPADASVYWLPTALLFLRLARSRAAGEAAAVCAVFVAVSLAWALSSGGALIGAPYIAIDVVEAGALALATLRLGGPRFALRPPRAALAFFAAAAAASAAAGAAAGLVPGPVTPRGAPDVAFLDTALPFAMGDFTAYATLGAAGLMASRLTRPRLAGLVAGRRAEFAAVVAGLAAAIAWDFEVVPALLGRARETPPHPALLFASYPLLIWLAFRFRALGATVAILLTAVPAIQLAAAGFGPFWLERAEDKVLVLQGYIAVCAVSATLVAAMGGEIVDRERRLGAAVALADRRARANGDFLMRISHELRTPLNAICGFADLIAEGAPDERRVERDRIFAREIVKAGERMAALVDSVLDVTRGGAARLALAPEPVHLAALVEAAAGPLRRGAAAAGVDLAVEAPPELRVWADPAATRHVIAHLLANALRHAAPGGTVAVEARAERGGARLVVRDDGPGFAPDGPREGDPFIKRADGAGLGLALVETLMLAQGGTVAIDSVVGRGTVARLGFAMPPPEADEPSPAA
jgi:signal transduction histidine kinase